MRLIGLFFMAVTAVPGQQQRSPAKEGGSPFLAILPPSEGLRFEAPLPPFEAKDVAGRTWRLEDLRGKLTLTYVWNSFEARAVDAHDARIREVISGLSDLPAVQRFYTQVRESKDIQVLTFCSDYDYTHASEYMREKNYSFPVIADWVLIKKLFPAGNNPPFAVINRDGRLSSPIGSWSLGRVLYELERAPR